MQTTFFSEKTLYFVIFKFNLEIFTQQALTLTRDISHFVYRIDRISRRSTRGAEADNKRGALCGVPSLLFHMIVDP